MVKKIVLVALVVFIFGCSSTKNEYEMARFKLSRFTIKPNENKEYIKHIDTSVFYMSAFSEEYIKKYNLENYNSGIKFYGDGRVGYFKGSDFNKPESFNPKKAKMGYYNYNTEGFFIEYFYKIPGGINKLAKKEVILSKSSFDTLFIKTFESATSSKKIMKYVKRKMPKEAFNYKPDW